ncbi:MAG TPA: PASTA domain-containing protein [Erysipelothrix sp.]|nr:PASTA domain-containing protein [Erysipelothrix sp.]
MSQPKRKRYFVFRKTIAAVLLTILVGALLVVGFGLNMLRDMINERPELNLALLETTESSIVYDADGVQFAELALKLSDNITYEELPNAVVDAFISIEDAKFFDHEGFDLARFTNEGIQTILRFIRGGGFGAGASTITMQTIKNSHFATDEEQAEESIDRKAQEISLSMELEEIIDKKKILEHYLNKINFGVPNSRGIAKASLYYFNKSVGELNISEAAYLAGVINAPADYNAYTDIEAATERRNVVLDMMLRHGYITEEEHSIHTKVKLENQLYGAEKYYGDIQPHQEYLDAVIDELENVYGLSPYTQGLKVYTALNRSQQETIETLEEGRHDFYFDDVIDAAYVSLNHTNGEIIALGGGRKFHQEDQEDVAARQFNNALQLRRQPGSVLKPILPYAFSYEHLGYATTHTIEDGPYAYIGSPVFVSNFTVGLYQGDVTVRDAVAGSLNIPAIKTMDELLVGPNAVGYERMTQSLIDLGFDPEISEYINSAYGIGGGIFEASAVQIAGAHATVMNGGQYIKPHTITRIEIEGREPIVPNFEPVQVMSPQAAYMAASTMRYAVETTTGLSTAARLNRMPFPVYAKTGTSDHDAAFVGCGIPDGATKDNWHAASTSDITSVAWSGYIDYCNNGESSNYIYNNAINANNLGYQLNILLQNVATFTEPTAIARPEGIVDLRHVVGVYPYATPIEGMDSSYIVNGMIIDRFSRLTTLETQTLENLASQQVEIKNFTDEGLELEVKLSEYPDEEKLEVAEKTKVMTATNSLGETRSATGNRLFDPSWIYGAVQYVTEIRIDGNVVETVESDEATRTITLPDIKSNQNLQVCSYYNWSENEIGKSNEICQTINSGSQKLSMPDFVGRNVSEAQEWITANTSAGITLRQQTPSSTDQVGRIISISPNYSNTDTTQDVFDRTNFVIVYYDGEITNLQSYVGKPVATLVNDLSGYFTLDGPTDDVGARVATVSVNGQAVNSVPIRPGTVITFTVEQAPDPGEGDN